MAACRDLQWNHDTSTFIAQKRTESQKSAVRRVKELLSHWCKADCQKNGGTVRWTAGVICATCMIKWPLARQHSRRDLARHLSDHRFHLGTLVEDIPITPKDKSSVHQFGKQTLKGIFFGYVLRVGRGWSGDVMISDYEDLQESEASDLDVKRFKNQEVFVKRRIRIPVCKRNFETSSSSKAVIDSTG